MIPPSYCTGTSSVTKVPVSLELLTFSRFLSGELNAELNPVKYESLKWQCHENFALPHELNPCIWDTDLQSKAILQKHSFGVKIFDFYVIKFRIRAG